MPAAVDDQPTQRARAVGAHDRRLSTNIFISSREVRFREMEYAIPVEAIPDALREVRAMIEKRRYGSASRSRCAPPPLMT